MRTMLLAAAVLSSILVVGLLSDFLYRSQPSDESLDISTTAVVFTGQYDRIELGLELLSSGRLKRLFISGVNPKAGLRVDTFADQFALTSRQRIWLEKGTIVLAPYARSTLQNAIETACWVERHSDVQAVALITSQRHLARASLALERAIAPVQVVRVAADADNLLNMRWIELTEIGKFAITWIATLEFASFWPANRQCQAN